MRKISYLLFLISFFCFLPAQASSQHWSSDYDDLRLFRPIEGVGAGSASYSKKLSGTFAAGVIDGPDYLGSKTTETRFLPVIDLEFKQRFFISTQRGIGFYALRDNRFALAVMLNEDWGRKESDNPHLRGLGNINPSTQIGAALTWRILPWLNWDVDAYQAIFGRGREGSFGDIGFSTQNQVNSYIVLRTNADIRWANNSYIHDVYGVDAAQAARSGLRQYNASSGLVSYQLGGALDFALSRHWFFTPTVRYVRLMNSAADSPITQDKSQFFGGAYFGYKF